MNPQLTPITRHTTQNSPSQPKTKLIKTKRLKGQVTLEFSIAFIAVIILIFACMRLFFWLNDSLVRRQQAYQASRIDATTLLDNRDSGHWTEFQVGTLNFYTPPPLRILGEEGIIHHGGENEE